VNFSGNVGLQELSEVSGQHVNEIASALQYNLRVKVVEEYLVLISQAGQMRQVRSPNANIINAAMMMMMVKKSENTPKQTWQRKMRLKTFMLEKLTNKNLKELTIKILKNIIN
jgi:hypothetical protein